MYLVRSRKTRGGAIIETVAGLFVMVPIILFMIDGIAMVLAQTANDALAKKCARAAASEPDQPKAAAAVSNVISGFSSPVLTNVTANITSFDAASTVRVQTQVTFVFPVQVPIVGATSQIFVADATQPVVGALPP
ncbi:MAG TPA: hypothetical protein PKC98_04010 [Candidatus Melainabacteria bacterium]|nr:hypothetical protein [Candidatus Melainabacteria bacterium]